MLCVLNLYITLPPSAVSSDNFFFGISLRAGNLSFCLLSNRERLISNDQLDTFRERDTITSLAGFNETTDPDGEETKFPKILESIKIDSDLHVQLEYNGIPVPLPQWFVQGHNVRLKNVSMLENLPAYIRNVTFNNYNELLDELNKRQFLKPKGRLPYSVEMIRYGLLLDHTSFQPKNVAQKISTTINFVIEQDTTSKSEFNKSSGDPSRKW